MNRINNGQKSQTGPIYKEYQLLRKELTSIETKKDKILGLYEDAIITKADLAERLAKLNEEKQTIEKRLTPLETRMGQGSIKEITTGLVKEVMANFVENYKRTLTVEQRKQLLQLLIKQITISESKKIDTIQIQLNNNIVKHLCSKGEEESSDDDFSSPFCICFDI